MADGGVVVEMLCHVEMNVRVMLRPLEAWHQIDYRISATLRAASPLRFAPEGTAG